MEVSRCRLATVDPCKRPPARTGFKRHGWQKDRRRVDRHPFQHFGARPESNSDKLQIVATVRKREYVLPDGEQVTRTPARVPHIGLHGDRCPTMANGKREGRCHAGIRDWRRRGSSAEGTSRCGRWSDASADTVIAIVSKGRVLACLTAAPRGNAQGYGRSKHTAPSGQPRACCEASIRDPWLNSG